jgi:hypothetical protein
MVVVSSAVTEPKEIMGVKIEGVRMRHWEWTIVEPITANTTKVSVYHSCVPQVVDHVIDRSYHVQSAMNMLVNNLARELDTHHQRLENRLVTMSGSETHVSDR